MKKKTSIRVLNSCSGNLKSKIQNLKKWLRYSIIFVLLGGCAGMVAAQQPAKVPRIAFLAGGSRSGDSLLIETFWQRMKELGYFEGKNITAEYRFAEGALERLPNLATDLMRLNVDIIVPPGSWPLAANKATNTN